MEKGGGRRERNGLEVLMRQARVRFAKLSRVEKMKRKERQRKRRRFFKNPFRFMKDLLELSRSGAPAEGTEGKVGRSPAFYIHRGMKWLKT